MIAVNRPKAGTCGLAFQMEELLEAGWGPCGRVACARASNLYIRKGAEGSGFPQNSPLKATSIQDTSAESQAGLSKTEQFQSNKHAGCFGKCENLWSSSVCNCWSFTSGVKRKGLGNKFLQSKQQRQNYPKCVTLHDINRSCLFLNRNSFSLSHFFLKNSLNGLW